MKTLYLVRHAKSSWKDSSLPDTHRPLNKRGNRNAPAMGAYLAQSGSRVDRIISSPAVRALTTARLIATELDYPLQRIDEEGELYFSGEGAMLNLIKEIDENISALMLVGHNPDMTGFVNRLCGDQVGHMPTCAVARIEFAGAWRDIEPGAGRLADLKTPREL